MKITYTIWEGAHHNMTSEVVIKGWPSFTRLREAFDRAIEYEQLVMARHKRFRTMKRRLLARRKNRRTNAKQG